MKFSTKIKFFPFYVISLLPMFILNILSDLVYVIAYHIIKYRRKVVRENLKNSFTDKSEQEIILIEKKFYKHFSDIVFEAVKSLTISKEEIKKRFSIKNLELIEKYYAEGRSIILYTGHHGNWEWLIFLALFIPYQTITFYQPLSNKYFNELMRTIRERIGVICVESTKGYKTIISFKQQNILTLTCLIGDQSPTKKATKHWVQFLNQNTAFLIGPDRIANKSNQVVLFPAFEKSKRGHYTLDFKVIEEEPAKRNNYEIIDKYAKLLEETIIKSPELWLWSHRRWKLKMSAASENAMKYG